MSNGTIAIVAAEEQPASTRGGRGETGRVAAEVSVATLRDKFNDFMASLQEVFAADALKTQAGVFEVTEIQFSAELSASGDFKLLGTGVGVTASSTLIFTLQRKES